MMKRTPPFEKEFEHVKARARERYGLVIDRSHYDKMANHIRMGWFDVIEEEQGQTILRVRVGKGEVAAVWDTTYGCVTTLLPRTVLEGKR